MTVLPTPSRPVPRLRTLSPAMRAAALRASPESIARLLLAAVDEIDAADAAVAAANERTDREGFLPVIRAFDRRFDAIEAGRRALNLAAPYMRAALNSTS